MRVSAEHDSFFIKLDLYGLIAVDASSSHVHQPPLPSRRAGIGSVCSVFRSSRRCALASVRIAGASMAQRTQQSRKNHQSRHQPSPILPPHGPLPPDLQPRPAALLLPQGDTTPQPYRTPTMPPLHPQQPQSCAPAQSHPNHQCHPLSGKQSSWLLWLCLPRNDLETCSSRRPTSSSSTASPAA